MTGSVQLTAAASIWRPKPAISEGYFQRLTRIKATESSRLMERAMGIEPTSETGDGKIKNLDFLPNNK